MMRCLGELSPEDVDADPLVVLPCRHAFLVSTLDGHLDMGRWGAGGGGGAEGDIKWGGQEGAGGGRWRQVGP